MLPSKEQYEANTFDDLKVKMKTYLGECHEEMMIDSHKRNRERGESKLKFQVFSSLLQHLRVSKNLSFLQAITFSIHLLCSSLYWMAVMKILLFASAWSERYFTMVLYEVKQTNKKPTQNKLYEVRSSHGRPWGGIVKLLKLWIYLIILPSRTSC